MAEEEFVPDLKDAILQEVTPGQQAALVGADRLGQAIDYGAKSGTHVWVATALYLVSGETLDSPDKLLLDRENLAQILVGCFACEQAFDKRLLKRRCPGEPKRRH